MKTLPLALLFSLFLFSINAQSTIEGIVFNSVDKEPATYVNIGVKGSSKGTVSDLSGNFVLENVEDKEVIVFSAIGFETQEVAVKALLENGTVELMEKAYMIPALEVKASRFDGEEEIFGVKNKTRGTAIGFGNPQLGTQIGALIYINKPTLIKNANFVLVHAKGDSLLLRLNIYKYEDGVVGESLLTENIFIIEKQRKGTFTIDLSSFDLILDSSVMLSLEWLRDFEERGNKDITFDTKRGKKLKGIYLKTSNTSDFRKLPFKKALKPCIYFKGKRAK